MKPSSVCAFVLVFNSLVLMVHGDESEEATKCRTGNFAVEPSQMPGPLVGFGEHVIGENLVQLYNYGDAFLGRNKRYIDFIPDAIYGVTDTFSVTLNVPVAVQYKEDDEHSYGLEDISLQFEYAYFGRSRSCFIDQATIVGAVSFPTGSSSKKPPTGFGAVTYFIGGTYSYTLENWFWFTAYGALFPMSHGNSRDGNQYLYQFGFGRYIGFYKGWLFDWIVEIDGLFSSRSKQNGMINPDSGGNVIYMTPSLFAANKNWIVQFGFGFVVQQHQFGHQNREKYLGALGLAYTF